MKKVFTYITPLLVALIGWFNSFESNKLAVAMQEMEVKNKHIFDSLLMLKQSQELAKFDREFKFKIYEDVKKAVKDGDETLQKFTADFITVMVQDVVFRDALLKSLIASKNLPSINLLFSCLYKFKIKIKRTRDFKTPSPF